MAAAASIWAIWSSAVPRALLKSPDVGQIDRIPISISMFSSSARARTLRRLSGASATCQSAPPRKRISLKCTMLTFILAAQSSISNGVQFCAPRLYMSTPNRTVAAAAAGPGPGIPIASAPAPTVFKNVRRSLPFIDMDISPEAPSTILYDPPAMMRRRDFLAAACAVPLLRAIQPRAIRLGGPIFLKSDDPGELAREHRRWGYSAAYCPAARADDGDRIRAIRTAFAAERVAIAEVGAWRNMLDPDAEKRAGNLRYVTERLALAEAVEARCCVDIAGSYNATVWYGPHPKNLSQEFFDATVENCRKVLDAVKPRATKFSIEMMGWSLPDGPDSYLKLIRAVDRPDAKDLAWIPEYNVHFREVVPGTGQIDYATYLGELAKLPVDAPLMLEHLQTPEEYTAGRDYIRSVGTRLGVPFA